jgi:hypothetical protein
MYYTIYKISNKLDGKFYIGSHKTKKLDDDYMGSGKYLKLAIEKYGIENFEKEVLFVFDTPEEMYKKEAEIVNEEFLITENTYNLKVGGFGGWDHENKNSEKQRNKCMKGNQKQKWLSENDPTWKGRDAQQRVGSENLKKAHIEGKIKYDTFSGKSHTDETKSKIGMKTSILQKGEKNSQFGTTWIWCKEEGNKKIKKELLQEYLDKGWEKKYYPGYRK